MICEEISPNISLKNHITPKRYIPFDLGRGLNDFHKKEMEEYFRKNNFRVYGIPKLLQSFSKDIIFVVQIEEKLQLYIFSFGIGVFSYQDKDYPLIEKYAVDYCEYRKKAHKEILNFCNKEISEKIAKIIEKLRFIAKTVYKKDKKRIRNSANSNWECNGLSYVMTVSFIQNSLISSFEYEKFSDLEKKNLQILLQPSLAHQEDTMTLEDNNEDEENFDPYNIQINKIENPVNWINSEDCGIYISWAAVIVYTHKFNEKYVELIDYLEVSLQAMWLYTYCQYINLKKWTKDSKLSSTQLKRVKYKFQRRFNEFLSDNDSSIPEYIFKIKNELVRTSGIIEEKENFIEYLEFCIDETKSIEQEKQRKYSVVSEVLLFVIAFLQIAPLVYTLLIGDFTDIAFLPLGIIFFFMVIGIIFIIKKD